MGIFKRDHDKDFTASLGALADNLDLTTSFSDISGNGLALQQFVNQLHQRMETSIAAAVGIAAQAPALASIATVAADTGGQLAQSAEMIASSSEEVATTIEAELVPQAVEMAALSSQVASAVRTCEKESSVVGGNIDMISQSERQLASVIASLQKQLVEVVRVIGVISSISKQTNLLALNAAIEAARAGVHGRGFAVVADEVRALAGNTTEATDQVSAIIELFRADVDSLGGAGQDMQSAVASGEAGVRHMQAELCKVRTAMDELDLKVSAIAGSTEQMGVAVSSMSKDVQTVSHAATELQQKSVGLDELGRAVHRESDNLLEGIGGFKLEIHQRAQTAICKLAEQSTLVSGTMEQVEILMKDALARDPRFELLYLVDSHGRQLSENIFADDVSHKSESARGKDWSRRAWFTRVAETGSPHVTDVYRSSATDDFCFTVSVPVLDASGKLQRVLGADARLSALL